MMSLSLHIYICVFKLYYRNVNHIMFSPLQLEEILD